MIVLSVKKKEKREKKECHIHFYIYFYETMYPPYCYEINIDIKFQELLGDFFFFFLTSSIFSSRVNIVTRYFFFTQTRVRSHSHNEKIAPLQNNFNS